jgi:hypothetical protein
MISPITRISRHCTVVGFVKYGPKRRDQILLVSDRPGELCAEVFRFGLRWTPGSRLRGRCAISYHSIELSLRVAKACPAVSKNLIIRSLKNCHRLRQRYNSMPKAMKGGVWQYALLKLETEYAAAQ